MRRTRSRSWRWIKRVLLGVVGLLAIAIGVVAIAVHTTWGRDKLRTQVERQLQATFTGGATLGRVEGSPFSQLILHDVVINGPDRKPAISVKALTVDVAILALMSHQARVLAVRAEDVDVDLRRDANGELQISRLMRPGPKSTWSVVLPRVELRRAHIRVDTGTEIVNIDGLTLDGRAKLPSGGPIDASIEASGTWRERAAVIDLQTVLHSDDAGLVMPSFSLKAGDVSVIANHVTVGTAIDGAPTIGGVAIIDARAAAVERLIPTLRLPADIALTISARTVADQRWIEVGLAGHVDQTAVRYKGQVDLAARHARGELVTGTVDLTALTGGKLTGTAAATVVFDAKPGGPSALPVATATINGWAALDGMPRTEFKIAAHSAAERARAVIDATGEGITAQLVANIRMLGERLEIEDARLHAIATDPARASGGKAPVHGWLKVDLTANGTVRPTTSLAVVGTVDGKNLRMQDLSVSRLHVGINAGRLPSRPYGTARIELDDIVRQNMQLGQLTVDATDRPDGRIAVAVRSRPKQNPWLIDADALVTPPDQAGMVAIDLISHRVRAGTGVDWAGRTGHVEIAPAQIVVRDLTSASRVGKLAISGSYQRAGRRAGDLAANIDATGISLENLGRDYRGRVDTHVAVTRRGRDWQGEVVLDATGLSLQASGVVFATHVRAALADRHLAVSADASSELGGGKLALDVDAPGNVADPAAWKRLGRSAIRTGALTLRGVDLQRVAEAAGLEGVYGGQINGDIQISATTIGGRVEATKVIAPQTRGLGEIGAVLDLSQTAPGEVAPTLTVAVDGIGRVSVQARLEAPERLFDPVAWRQLGRGALRGATVRADQIAVDPAMLDRVGIVSEMRGKVAFAVDIGEAARSVNAVIDVGELRGGAIVQPIDVHLEAATDDRATRTTLTVKTKGAPLLDLQGQIPVPLAQLLERGADREAALATPLTGSVKLASVDAPRLLAVFGRSEVIAGSIDGTVEISGTVGSPHAKASFTAVGLEVPPGPRGKPVRVVDRLSLMASWDGTTAKVDINGTESDGGKLVVSGAARPSALREGKLKITATKFDMVPILAFLPGPAGGAAGQLDANLTLDGLDLRTSRIAGEIHLLDGRIPIAPTIGTLRRAKIDAVIADRHIKLAIDGRLGGGSVTMNGAVALDGAAPSSGNATIKLRKISPIGSIEPQVTADVTARLSRENNRWRADLVVENAFVVVPDERGEKLKPVGLPSDMVFASAGRGGNRPGESEAPTNPILVSSITLRSARVESEQFRGIVRGKLDITADGSSIGVFGEIEADRGDLDLFSHRYYVERAAVRFDGSFDPLLDIRISHEFGTVTTFTEVHGRASQPELIMSSDPGTYSQGQLLGFLLGGEPGGDPAAGSASDMATSAGESFIANKIGGYVRDALPIDVDVLRYEAATSTSSAAVTVGSWITHSLFLAYRVHLESRPNENTGEGELEYWLGKRVMIEAVAGDHGNVGIDLLWRRRY